MGALGWLKRAVKGVIDPPILVLMYHRVATPDTDPWQLAVSPAVFEQQLQILQKKRLVVPLTKLTDQILGKFTPKRGVVLTFDDGYADNYLIAKPLLEKYEIPATFFISTKHLGQRKEFWWDELDRMLLHSERLPQTISLAIGEVSFSYDLEQDRVLTENMRQKHQVWDYTQILPTRRTGLYMKLWEMLSPLPYQDQQALLQQIRTWADLPECPRPEYRSMTEPELQHLASKELFTIGAHTVSHPALAHHSEEVQRQEIEESKRFLSALTGQAVDLFAFPSGNFNNTTIDVVKQQQFRAAFTTAPALVSRKTNPLKIGRYQVYNWNRSEFTQFLSYHFMN